MARQIIPVDREAAMTFSALTKDCARYLLMRGYSPETVSTYETRWGQFRAFMKMRTLDDDVRSFTGPVAFGYCGYLGERHASPNTILGQLAALSTLARYAMKAPSTKGSPILGADPTKTFDWPVPTRPETKYLLPGELRAFLALEVAPYMALARDLALETGLRASELCRASVGDLRAVGGRYCLAVTVKGRGSRERTVEVPLSAAMAEVLSQRFIASSPDDPILTDHTGRRLKRTGLSSLLDRLGQRAGITRFRVSAHKLRHTANVLAKVAGIDPMVRSKLLNHTDPRSLERYEHLVPGELHDARERQQDALQSYIRHTTDSEAPVQKYGSWEDG